jgi:hypothetical protein
MSLSAGMHPSMLPDLRVPARNKGMFDDLDSLERAAAKREAKRQRRAKVAGHDQTT